MTNLFQNLFKEAGGPGSGVREDNAKPIPESILKQSEVVRIGGRKGIMDTQPHEERDVPVEDLQYACQDNYVPGKYERIKEKMSAGELDDKPIAVLDVDGELHVLDGHHRAMAAIALKKKHIKANVYKGVNKKMEKKAFWEGFFKEAGLREDAMGAATKQLARQTIHSATSSKPVTKGFMARMAQKTGPAMAAAGLVGGGAAVGHYAATHGKKKKKH